MIQGRPPMKHGAGRWRRPLASGGLLCLLAAAASAQTVAFSGMLGDKALLVINGQARGVPVGGQVQGVKLVRLDGTTAQVEVAGKTQSLHLGGAAIVAGDSPSGSSGSRIVLPAGSGGHYVGLGSINGHSVPFLIDTGATSVAMGADMAVQLGLDPNDSTATAAITGNGTVAARRISLKSVRIGDVIVYNVEAMVLPQPMPVVLLGNTFLSHFTLHSDSTSLVLEKKN